MAHDNDTVVGWFNSQPGASTLSEVEVEKERVAAMSYFGALMEVKLIGIL